MANMRSSTQDQRATMETNSYSIVSKRSVEKLYLSDEPAFLEPFVPSWKRRAPLINRGYWLRMKAIETAVQSFMQESSSGKKIVVNLGCGYDPMPFRMLHRGSSDGVSFVDVDYPELIKRKVDVIVETPSFMNVIGPIIQHANDEKDALILQSSSYTAIGADLADVESLERVFKSYLSIHDEAVLFIAEVSITYMTLEKADQLIRWTSDFRNARFCVLEQFLPDGPDHPFARTMLDHFAKQQAPIQSVMKYHSLDQHRDRFLEAGWNNVTAQSLWDYWEDPSAMTIEQRLALDTVEPFDEWEEFILFSSHYFLLIASNAGSSPPAVVLGRHTNGERPSIENLQQDLHCDVHQVDDIATARRYGKAGVLSEGVTIILGGIPNSSTAELYTPTPPANIDLSPTKVTAGHTLTEVGDGVLLLVGGRKSPRQAKADCFIYDYSDNRWTRGQSIEPARYRHCAVPVSIDARKGVLVHGGITSTGEVLADWQLWFQDCGWLPVEARALGTAKVDLKLFGASILALDADSGILTGGLNDRRAISDVIMSWKLVWERLTDCQGGHRPIVAVQLSIQQTMLSCSISSARFGADLVNSHWGPLLIGGVARAPIPFNKEIIALHEGFEVQNFPSLPASRRPLLTGASVATLPNNDVLITGGGAVCFSFGQCINTEWYQMRKNKLEHPAPGLKRFVVQQDDCFEDSSDPKPGWTIEQAASEDQECIRKLMEANLPWTISGVDAGACLTKWTTDCLLSSIAPDTIVSIHEGTARDLRFYPEKNFVYRTCPFSELYNKIDTGAHVYLRSLASESPFQKPANLWQDFPGIAQDFKIPRFLDEHLDLTNKLHSSVLRLSGNVAIWLHYDVMSNFLFQIRGSKNVILYPPTEALSMRFAPGSTTSPIPITEIEAAATESAGQMTDSKCKKVTLHPGDVLFIPRFWLHATTPGPSSDNNDGTDQSDRSSSVAVNVFWRDLDIKAYAAGRDVYGSRDLGVYENGRKAVARIAQRLRDAAADDDYPGKQQQQVQMLAEWLQDGGGSGNKGQRRLDPKDKIHGEVERLRRKFAHLPKDVGAFYLPRLADELLQLYCQNT